MLYQWSATTPEELGVYAIVSSIYLALFTISDSFSLQLIIQFGARPEKSRRANLFSLLLHVGFTFGVSIIIYLLRHPFSIGFSEPRFIEAALYIPILAIANIPRTYFIKFVYKEHRMNLLFFINLVFFGTMTALTFYLITSKGNIVFYDLVMINIIGTSLSSIFAFFVALPFVKLSFSGSVTLVELLRFSYRYLISTILHIMPKQLDIVLLKFFFPSDTIGIYYSAKNLYRVFDEILNAANGLVYPAAIRQHEQGKIENLKDLMTKSISFLLISFIPIVILLTSGLTGFIISFLPEKFALAEDVFNILVLAAIPLPFILLSSILIVRDELWQVIKFMAISVVFWLAAILTAGYLQIELLIPTCLIVYNLVLGILLFLYIKKKIGFPVKMLFRALSDSYNFLKYKLIKNRI